MEILYNVWRKTSFGEDLRDMFDNGRRLGRGFQNNCIARQEGRYEGVDKDQVWILYMTS